MTTNDHTSPPAIEKLHSSHSTFSQNFFDVETVDELKREVKGILNNIGFSDCTFTWVPTTRSTSVGIFQTMPSEMYAEYIKLGYNKHDMLIQHSRRKTTPVYITEVYDVATRPRFYSPALDVNRKCYEYVADLGYLDFYNIPMKTVHGQGNVMFSITTHSLPPEKFSKLVDTHKATLHLLVQIIDMIWTTKFPNARILKNEDIVYSLGEQTLKIFSTLANGDMSVKQVADQCNVSLSTANYHISTVKSALGVSTIYAALRKARNMGLIEYETED